MKNRQDIAHNLSDDLQFLIACCQTEQSNIDTDFILNYLSEKDEGQYHNLITLATQHGILPLVHKTLQAQIAHETVQKRY